LRVQEPVESSAVDCSLAGNGSGIISIAKILYQETSSEDMAEEQSLWRAVAKERLVEITEKT
jgi:hypothetical protein